MGEYFFGERLVRGFPRGSGAGRGPSRASHELEPSGKGNGSAQRVGSKAVVEVMLSRNTAVASAQS